jgi:hypothetical protein
MTIADAAIRNALRVRVPQKEPAALFKCARNRLITKKPYPREPQKLPSPCRKRDTIESSQMGTIFRSTTRLRMKNPRWALVSICNCISFSGRRIANEILGISVRWELTVVLRLSLPKYQDFRRGKVREVAPRVAAPGPHDFTGRCRRFVGVKIT